MKMTSISRTMSRILRVRQYQSNAGECEWRLSIVDCRMGAGGQRCSVRRTIPQSTIDILRRLTHFPNIVSLLRSFRRSRFGRGIPVSSIHPPACLKLRRLDR
jgi:hypothetical protein